MLLMRRILILLTVILILMAWSNTMSKREAERDRLNHPDGYDQEVPSQMEVPHSPGPQPTPAPDYDEVPRGGHPDGRAAPRYLHSA